MPAISMFYGIVIRMFFHDAEKHKAPHIHAEYQGEVAVYSEIRKEDLLANWNLAVNGQAPLPVRGLDS